MKIQTGILWGNFQEDSKFYTEEPRLLKKRYEMGGLALPVIKT